MRKAQKEGVVTILDGDDLVAIIYKDPISRQNVFFKTSPMGMEELEQLLITIDEK